MKILCLRTIDGLRPVDDKAREDLSKVKLGKSVLCEVKQARNPAQHRLYWGLIGLLHPNQSRYATQEQLSNAMKCAVGWCDEIELKDGRIMAIPKSISFANMPQSEFAEFFDKIMDLATTRIIPGLDKGALRTELEQITGISQ